MSPPSLPLSLIGATMFKPSFFTTVHHDTPCIAYALREIHFALHAMNGPARVSVAVKPARNRLTLLRVRGPRAEPA